MRLTGIKAEELAVTFPKRKGYRILRSSFKPPIGEIDIIAEEGNTLVFVEVKTRTDDSFGHRFEAVDFRKKEKLRKVALSYLKQCKKELPSRFDVPSIEMDRGKSRIAHIIDVFE